MRFLLKCLLCSIIICSCSCNDGVKRQLKKMHGLPVNISCEGMRCWCPATDGYSSLDNDTKLTYVIYSDTSDCSLCYLQHLELWNDFVDMEKEHEGIVRFLFVMEARKEENGNLYEQLGITNLKHCIYVDENTTFSKNNPQIPTSAFFHTFLLDEEKKVILVGDPTKNEKIESIFMKIVKEAISSSENNVFDSTIKN